MGSRNTAGDENTSLDSAVPILTSVIERRGRQSDGLQDARTEEIKSSRALISGCPDEFAAAVYPACAAVRHRTMLFGVDMSIG